LIPLIFGLIFSLSIAWSQNLTVIVNSQNPMTSLSRSQLADFYLKKVKSWPDGVPLRVFDRNDNSVLRKEFLKYILHRTPRDIELYWIGQKLYTGHSAPTQVSTDTMVEIMVSRFPGAIGYISKDHELTRPVKKISITE
jgi:ABC-type phosphate transport system substrate-binding protein